MWRILVMTLLFQKIGNHYVSAMVDNTNNIRFSVLSSQEDEGEKAKTFSVENGIVHSNSTSKSNELKSDSSTGILTDQKKPSNASNLLITDLKSRHESYNNEQENTESKNTSGVTGKLNLKEQGDGVSWKNWPKRKTIAKPHRNTTTPPSDFNHDENHFSVHSLKRYKRGLRYLHRAKRFMIPIGISKKKTNFLDNFRKRVSAIQSNREKLKESGSRGMKLNFPFLGSNHNAFSNLRNSLKRIGDKIGRDIKWEAPMLGDDPKASYTSNKRVSCGGVQCHSKAICYRSRCRCQKGLTGDGVNTCQKMCKCTVSGDPHFHTFDGQILHLMGDCKYILSESFKSTDNCAFRVNIQNERRGSNKRVSWPKYVELYIYNQSIRLGPNQNVFVNGEAKTIPFMRLGKKIEVFQVSRSIQVTTECGVQLSFNGKTIAQLLVPDKFSGHLTGLCGDCNGKKDDLRTRQGEDVSHAKNKYSKIGASYVVKNDDQNSGTACNTQDLEAKCSKKMELLYSSSDYCGIIKDPQSVFRECVAADKDMANQYFESCMFDVCAIPNDNHTAMCDNIEVFALLCREMGFIVDWRDKDFCPIQCGPNMHYSSEVSGCPASCMQQEAPSSCTLPSNEGCQCNDGMVLSGKTCTYISDCGCYNENGDYIPLGEEKMADDCSQIMKCTKESGHAQLVPYKKIKCHKDADCSVVNGKRMCKCKSGFTGDGYKCLKGIVERSQEKPQGDAPYVSLKKPNEIRCGQFKCHEKASCIKGRCVCKAGLLGDGVNACNDVCICSAKGDPHYRTYDGETLTFMGPCKYLLTATTPKATKCQFKVLVTNEKRGGIEKVSWTKQVDIYIYKIHIRIDSSRKVYVNKEVRYLPSNELGGKIRLFRTGRQMVMSAECGLQVGFDGVHIVKVVAPAVLSRMMTGICGDCDGIKNDKRLKNGTDVSKLPTADTMVADSYREPMEKEKSKQDCFAYPVNSNCIDNKVIENYCSIIRNQKGPFQACIKAFPAMAEGYYQTCRIDVCSYQQNVFMIDEVGCDAVTSMSDACEEKGFLVNWRTSEFCPVFCHNVNTTYNYRMTGCPATCVDPNAPKTCTLPEREGCQCAKGLLLSDDICVEPYKCGCKTPTGSYLPVGTEKITSDCTHTLICERINGKSQLTTHKNKPCGEQASCVVESDGMYHCKCNPGFSGNPHNKCSKDPQDLSKYQMLADAPQTCPKCHVMAECLDGRCICKPGFLGDGLTSCEDKCFCTVSGDPHYITFDGQLINYQGSCSYLLSKSTVQGDPCKFQIYIKNKLLISNPRTVTPEEVQLEIYGHSYHISKNETYVDGQLKYSPSIHLDGKVQIFHTGNSNGVSTSCGVQVLFNQLNSVKVVVPRTYSQKMVGICGNCNRIHDDFRLLNGVQVVNDPQRDNLVGDSFLNPNYKDDSKCRGPKPIQCSQMGRSAAKSPDKCGLMEDTQGPFKQCISNAPDLAGQFFHACWLDLCIYGTKQEIICRKLSAFSDACASLGFPANWRSPNFCPAKCPPGMEFKSWSSGCLPTCTNPKPQLCDRLHSEGCTCETGYVISGYNCIKPNQCGCFNNKTGDYIPLGSKFLSTDCYKSECRIENGKAHLFESSKLKCDVNAVCTVYANQTFGCKCREGFTGNGFQLCKKSSGKPFTQMAIMFADQAQQCPQCHPQARCKYNRCICNEGFFGDGVNTCEEQCVCRASGDPHYSTYDGRWFHYMGLCRYIITQMIHPGDCNFRITAKNGLRKLVNGTRLFCIQLEFANNIYRIEIPKGKEKPSLYVNNVLTKVGSTLIDSRIKATRYGRRGIALHTPCNVTLIFDGENAVVSVKKTKDVLLRGMCGDCDGNKHNDLPTPNSLVIRDHVVYGDLWRAADPTHRPAKVCNGPIPAKCTMNQELNAQLNKNCGQLIDTNGPFRGCIMALRELMHQQFRNCKMEFCIVGASLKHLTCPKLETAASICAAHGHMVSWRTEKFCPLPCQANSQYNPLSSGCQATCRNPQAEKQCTLPPIENCVCNPGFLLNEATNKCVQKCPGDLDKPSADSPTKTDKCGWYKCAPNADCKKINGAPKCVCRDGFAGNGIDVCDVAHCACTASGDPHYVTFDSFSLYLLGDCKYTMAKTGLAVVKCPFKIEVKNEHRLYSKFPKRAFTRLVDIKINQNVYQLCLFKRLKVNGKLQAMPYENPSKTVSIKIEGKFMKLETQCGLKVRFDGVHAVIITVPKMYAGKMKGICGNCDGDPTNDLMLNQKDLSQMTNKTKAYEEFAKQYLVVDDSDKPATDLKCRINP